MEHKCLWCGEECDCDEVDDCEGCSECNTKDLYSELDDDYSNWKDEI